MNKNTCIKHGVNIIIAPFMLFYVMYGLGFIALFGSLFLPYMLLSEVANFGFFRVMIYGTLIHAVIIIPVIVGVSGVLDKVPLYRVFYDNSDIDIQWAYSFLYVLILIAVSFGIETGFSW